MALKTVPVAVLTVLMLSAGTRCRVAAAPPEVVFELSPQTLGSASVHEIGLADLDGDGDLDAVFSDYDTQGILNGVYFNDGNGVFTYSGQALPMPYSHGLGLADLDGDQDVDVFMTCADEDLIRQSAVFLNNGSGYFTQSPQNIGDFVSAGNDVYVFDIDGDGDTDALVDYYMEPNKVYENDGHGIFMDSGQVYPESAFFSDLDADGDTDILECDRIGLGYRTWINDGLGNFTSLSFLPNPLIVRSNVGFGDLDDDSDIDAVVTNGNWDVAYPTKVLLNDGTGVFTESETELSETYNAKVCVADLNDDTHNDIVIISYGKLNQLYVSDGEGGYTWSEFGNSLETLSGVPAVGDVDGDGLTDLFSPAFWLGTTQLWLNRTQLSCCQGRVGDANGSGEAEPDEVTLGDIMLLVDVKFVSGDCSKLECLAEADVNQDGGDSPNCDNHVTLGDIMTLVDFLFITGPENGTLPTCL